MKFYLVQKAYWGLEDQHRPTWKLRNDMFKIIWLLFTKTSQQNSHSCKTSVDKPYSTWLHICSPHMSH